MTDKMALPINPLDQIKVASDYQRRMVMGVIESYNGNYDLLAELVQNSVDAVEDAILLGQDPPYEIEIRIDSNVEPVSKYNCLPRRDRDDSVASLRNLQCGLLFSGPVRL